MTVVIGLDWSTSAEGRSAIEVRSHEEGIEVVNLHGAFTVTDSAVKRLASRCDVGVLAVDIPFGWPSGFTTFVERWTPAAPTPVPTPAEFRYRVTDQVMWDATGKAPMSVSAEKFAMGARMWAELVHGGGWGSRVDVDGSKVGNSPPPIVEVYPGATLRVLGFNKGYKGDKDKPRRRREGYAAALVDRFNVTPPDCTSALSVTDNELDAFVAALTGLAYLGKLPGWTVAKPSDEQSAAAEREGWIFYPVRDGGEEP